MPRKLTNRVIVIDGSMLIHKSQHVFKRLSVKSEDKTVGTGIAYGFLRAVMRLNKMYEPCETCVVFDNSMNVVDPYQEDAISYRQEILPEYKADRSHNTNLIDGVRLLFRFLKTLPVTVIYPTIRYEADDLIAFVARKAFQDHMKSKLGKYEIIVVSDDKDFNQLIHKTNGFSVALHKKKDDIWDTKKFRDKFGFAPDKFLPYLALLGDKGDNIRGVFGYGKVKAAALVRNFDADEIVQKLTNEEAALFIRNMTLISLNPQNDVVSRIYQHSLDRNKFNKLSRKYKMMSFLRKEEQELLDSINKVSFLEGTK